MGWGGVLAMVAGPVRPRLHGGGIWAGSVPAPVPLGHAFCILAPGVILHDGLRELRRDGLRLPLTPTEYHLLLCLIAHPDRITADDELIAAAWAPGAAVAPQTLYAHAASLRRKLGPRLRLVRRYGLGYHLEGAPAPMTADPPDRFPDLP